MMTFGRVPLEEERINFDSNKSTSIKPVRGSISTKSIIASQYNAQLDEATNVIGDVQTISFLDIPSAIHAR